MDPKVDALIKAICERIEAESSFLNPGPTVYYVRDPRGLLDDIRTIFEVSEQEMSATVEKHQLARKEQEEDA